MRSSTSSAGPPSSRPGRAATATVRRPCRSLPAQPTAEEPSAGAADLGLGPAEALAEIEAREIVLRDIERGLVDFPSRHPGGRQVLLCWQLGEPDVEWWHLPEEGFAGRRPLPLPPEL